MNNDEQYAPSEDEMRHAYWLTRMLDHHAAVNAAFDRFLARVRRDAARDAVEDADYWQARAYEAEGKLWKADARIRHLEATAQVLVKEALDAENARDESRRGKAEAEARIKAVQHLIDQADEMCEWAITCTRLQWAIDGSAPQPGA